MLGQELMPKNEREDISSVKPTGWKNKKIKFNGKQDYLYNRSHLIGFQLTGENINVKNLFTGTRALMQTLMMKNHLWSIMKIWSQTILRKQVIMFDIG